MDICLLQPSYINPWSAMRRSLFAVVICSVGVASAQPADCRHGLEALQANRPAEAIDPLSQCLKQQLPARARAFVLQARANAYADMKEWALAAEDQRQSTVEEKPKDAWPHIMLGAYLRDAGRLDESLEALRAAMQFDEDGPGSGPGMAVHYHTARTLHEMGRYSDAIEAMTSGIPKQPDYGYALYQRALSYEALGDRVQAKRDFFRAAELVPKEGYEPKVAAKLIEYGFTVKVNPE